jgi:hypothetical protein
MVNKRKGGGRAPPTLTSQGWFFHQDGMYARNWPLPLCVYPVLLCFEWRRWVHTYVMSSQPQSTHRGNCRYLAYIPSWWQNQPWLMRGCTPTAFQPTTITYKVAVYAPAERADTLPLFHLYLLCILWDRKSVYCCPVLSRYRKTGAALHALCCSSTSQISQQSWGQAGPFLYTIPSLWPKPCLFSPKSRGRGLRCFILINCINLPPPLPLHLTNSNSPTDRQLSSYKLITKMLQKHP